MMTILLYGFLGKQFGKVHRYAVKTPGEAIRALSATLPGFKAALIDGGAYRVLRGGKSALSTEQIAQPVSQQETLRIVPVVQGSRGLGQIILGAALWYATGPLGEFMAFNMGVGSAVTSFVTGAMSSIGISMMLSGVSSMLFSPPKTESVERAENKPSFAFDGAVNTAAQGNPVPVCYGRLIVGSQVISAGLSVDQI